MESGARGSSVLAWLTWAAATGGALVFVLLLGSDVPFWDEWELVPFVTGDQPVTPAFLWSLHSEHRIPLPRLAYLGLFWLARDFRAAMVFDVLALSGVAAFLILAARKARGRAAWTDGFLALALLNLGHVDNLICSFQIAFVLTAVLLAVSLGMAVGVRGAPSRARVMGIAGPLILAPLCGAMGVPVAAVAGAWLLGWAARRQWAERPAEDGSRAPSALLLAGLGLACWAVVAAYMYRYQGNPRHPAPAGLEAAAQALTELLSVALGVAGGWYWPWSAAAAIGLSIATVAALATWWRRSVPDRMAAEGLIAFLVVLTALSTAIAWGRSGFGLGAGMAGRYATLSTPVALWVYLAWCRLPWPRLARAVQLTCFAAGAALYPDNLTAGRELGEAQRAGLQALVKEVRQGSPPGEVARRFTGIVFNDLSDLRDRLVMLRRARLGPYSPWEEASRFRRRFPFLKEPLVAARDGIMTIRIDRVDGRPVIVVAPNGDLVFDVHPGRREVSGFFGLLPAFYAVRSRPGEGPYDGTYYEATFLPDEGEPVKLLARLLDPQHNPGDRGLLPFHLPLPGGGGKLVLSTRFGPPGAANANGWSDWGFWADIDLR